MPQVHTIFMPHAEFEEINVESIPLCQGGRERDNYNHVF